MTESERWAFIANLDEELLVGGVILSEWTSEIVRQADAAFASGASLASLLTAVAAIESHLRSEHGPNAPARLVDLIDSASLDSDLRTELHRIRRYRNRWVHVNEPWSDQLLLVQSESIQAELDAEARHSMRALRRVLYSGLWT